MIKKSLYLLFICVFLLILISCNLFGNDNDDEREIIDMANRKVRVPKEIDAVFSILPSGSMMIYSIDPDLLVGWNYGFNNDEEAFILENYRNLPIFKQGWQNINKEAIIAADTDVVIAYGELTDIEKKAADDFTAQTNIPVVMVDGSLIKAPEAYQFLGKLLNKEEKAEQLARYAEEALEYAENVRNNKTSNPKIYYGDGPYSKKTAPIGSTKAELFEILGANNVADLEADGSVNEERIIEWNPQVVILNGNPKNDDPKTPFEAVNEFKTFYTTVDAVKNNRVYGIPRYPFSWFDRPQSTNRLIGIYWLTDLLYQDEFEINLEEKAREFYELFYHIELTEEELAIILYK